MSIILDLGCGKSKKQGCIGIDRVGYPTTQADVVCNLGFDWLPYDTSSVERVHADAILEHIPMVVWSLDGRRAMPIVRLFNEIYRVLIPEGLLTGHVPCIGRMGQETMVHPVVFAGMEHCSFWTWDTLDQFSGNYYGYKDVYGHTSNFELVERTLEGEYLHFTMRAKK